MKKNKIDFIEAKLKVMKERIVSCNYDSAFLLSYIDEILYLCRADHLE